MAKDGAGNEGAPTSERFVAGQEAPLPTYEHAHRYALAASILRGRSVLDLACGSGDGTHRLRQAGIETLALDLDRGCARRASPAICADAARLPFADAAFGGVVCFEAIEHLDDPGQLVADVARVLAPGGVALFSTPDRSIFRERAGRLNPFHVSEMTAAELAACLGAAFPQVALFGQSVWAGSWISALGERASARSGDRSIRVESQPVDEATAATTAPWADPREDVLPTPMYLIAVCAQSHQALHAALRELREGHVLHDPAQSLLGDYLQAMRHQVERDELIRSQVEHAGNLERIRDEQRERIAQLEVHAENLLRLSDERLARIRELEKHAAQLAHRVATLEETGTHLEARAEGLQAYAANLEAEREDRSAQIEQLTALLAGGATERQALEARIRDLVSERETLRSESQRWREAAAQTQAELVEVRKSLSWRLGHRLRRLGAPTRDGRH